MDLAHRRCDEVFIAHAEQLHGIPVYEYNEDADTIQLKVRNGLDSDDEGRTIFFYSSTVSQIAAPVVSATKHTFSFSDVVHKGWVKHGDTLHVGDRCGEVDQTIIVENYTGYQYPSLVSFLTRAGQDDWRGDLDTLTVNGRYTWWQLEYLNCAFLVYDDKWLPLPFSLRLSSLLHHAADIFHGEERENIDEICESFSDGPPPFVSLQVEIVIVQSTNHKLWSRASFFGHHLAIYQQMLEQAARLGKVE